MRGRYLRYVITPLVALPLLAGCQTTSNRPSIARDARDECAMHRDGFTPGQTEQERTGQVATGAIVGGLVTGAVVALAGGSGGQIAAGVAGGALVGGLATYAWAKANEAEREQILAQRYGSIQNFASEVDRAQIAFDRALSCRQGQVAALKADLRGGRIDRPTAEARLTLIRGWQREDVTLAQSMAVRFTKEIEGQITAADEIQPGMVTVEKTQAFRPYNAVLHTDAAARPSSSGAGADGGMTLRAGQVVRVASVERGWARVEQNGRSVGYVRQSALVREGQVRRVIAQQDEAIRMAPEPQAAETGRLGKGQPRQATATLPGWVALQTSNTTRGFVPTSAVQGGVPVAGQAEGLVRATATNAQMADAFKDSVQTAQKEDTLSLDT